MPCQVFVCSCIDKQVPEQNAEIPLIHLLEALATQSQICKFGVMDAEYGVAEASSEANI